jgi:hypothetical protein
MSRRDVRLLALAMQGFRNQDAKHLAVAGARAVQGKITFDDGVVGRFEVSRP